MRMLLTHPNGSECPEIFSCLTVTMMAQVGPRRRLVRRRKNLPPTLQHQVPSQPQPPQNLLKTDQLSNESQHLKVVCPHTPAVGKLNVCDLTATNMTHLYKTWLALNVSLAENISLILFRLTVQSNIQLFGLCSSPITKAHLNDICPARQNNV